MDPNWCAIKRELKQAVRFLSFSSRFCCDHGVSLEVGKTACTHVEMGSQGRFEPASFECEVAAESS